MLPSIVIITGSRARLFVFAYPATGPGGQARLDMLRASAAALGVHQVRHLGYADSGSGPILFTDPPDRVRSFVRTWTKPAGGWPA